MPPVLRHEDESSKRRVGVRVPSEGGEREDEEKE